jgi:hypothetical protein
MTSKRLQTMAERWCDLDGLITLGLSILAADDLRQRSIIADLIRWGQSRNELVQEIRDLTPDERTILERHLGFLVVAAINEGRRSR